MITVSPHFTYDDIMQVERDILNSNVMVWENAVAEPPIPIRKWLFWYVVDDGSGDSDATVIQGRNLLHASLKALWYAFKSAWRGKFLLWDGMDTIWEFQTGFVEWVFDKKETKWAIHDFGVDGHINFL